jgi:hypothetical protein
MEELYDLLSEVNSKLTRSTLPRDKKRLGKTYPQSFKGARLIDWLSESEFAKSRAEAVAVAQRLLDVGYVWEVSGGSEMLDSETHIYSLSAREGLEKTLGPKAQLKTDGEHHAGWVLMKGVYYHRTYLVVSVDSRMCYLYHSLSDKCARHAINLSEKECCYTLYYSDDRELDKNGQSVAGSGSDGKKTLSKPDSKDSKDVKSSPSAPTTRLPSGSTITGIASHRPSKVCAVPCSAVS